MAEPTASPSTTPETEDETPQAGRQLPFLANPTVQKILPWASSLALHAGIIIFAVLLVKTVQVIREQIAVEQVLIPDTNLVDSPDAGGVPNPGINNEPDRAARQDIDPSVTESESVFDRKSDTLQAAISEGSADQQSNFTPIGFASKTSGAVTGLKTKGLGSGGGDLAPFGERGGGGGGLFKGTGRRDGGNIKRVIFVCDASGSMDSSKVWDVLEDQLKKAVDVLRPSQSFNVMFFQSGDPSVVDKSGLMRATPANKQRAYQAIAKTTRSGITNPLPAIREAFKQDPELIQLLTDAQFTGEAEPKEIIAEIARLNAERAAAGKQKVLVNTYLLVSQELSDEEQQTMKQIADENGGRYVYVKASDLIQ
jgi:von Willebrand factor type A domain